MPYHRAIDQARERLRGEGRIGTTGRGIGPTYEDKMARIGIRVADFLDEDIFARRAAPHHRREEHLPRRHSQGEAARLRRASTTSTASSATRLAPYVTDTGRLLDRGAARRRKRVLLEGAQGTMLDVDHGTYPFVTSSNTVAGAACTGAGHRAEPDHRRGRHRQGLHHARRQRPLPDRAARRARRQAARRMATSSAPPPGVRAAAAGSMPSSSATRSASTA